MSTACLTILLAGMASATVSKFATAVPPAFLNLLDHLFGRCGIGAGAVGGDAGIVDHDLGAFSGAQQRDLPPDAAAGAGDDDDFVLQ